MLGIPESVHRLLDRTHGLVLVTGPTGSGKSTTQAAMVDYINRTRPYHIITLEDPIEYVHKHQLSIVDQRSRLMVGAHAVGLNLNEEGNAGGLTARVQEIKETEATVVFHLTPGERQPGNQAR